MHVQQKLKFRFNEGFIQYDLENIKVENQEKLQHLQLEIHDYFVNTNGAFLYLVSDEEKKKTFWCFEHQINEFSVKQFKNFEKHNDFGKCDQTFLNAPCPQKGRTKGVLLTVYNCGIIASFREIFISESLNQVTKFLLDNLQFMNSPPKYLIYDNACKLEAYLKKRSIKDKSIRGGVLCNMTFVIDRLHIKNHTNENCHKYNNPYLFDDLININTVVCEETNFWLSRFKYIMKHMNKVRFNFFLYIICNAYNIQKLKLK